jgi:hypothetical protein
MEQKTLRGIRHRADTARSSQVEAASHLNNAGGGAA